MGYRIVIAVDDIEDLAPEQQPHRVRLSLRTRGVAPVPGLAVRVRAVLMPPPEPAAPGAYDFARALYFKGIGVVGYAVGGLEVRESAAPSSSVVAERIAAIRLGVASRIVAAMIDENDQDIDDQAAQVAVALLTGLRGRLSDETLSALRDAGLAHLLAISGLHLGLIAGILFFTVRLLLALNEPVALRYPIKKWAAIAALIGAFGYLLLTGATIPTQRAYIMVSLILFAVLIDREAVSMRPVAWAAVVVLVFRPESLLGASFQLSFAAVTALVAFYEWLRARSTFRSKPSLGARWVMLYFAAVMATTIVASLATAPFAAYLFNRVAVAGLIANLIAVPPTALWIMPWGLAAMVLMPFGLEALAAGADGVGYRSGYRDRRMVCRSSGCGHPGSGVAATVHSLDRGRRIVAHLVARDVALVGSGANGRGFGDRAGRTASRRPGRRKWPAVRGARAGRPPGAAEQTPRQVRCGGVAAPRRQRGLHALGRRRRLTDL